MEMACPDMGYCQEGVHRYGILNGGYCEYAVILGPF